MSARTLLLLLLLLAAPACQPAADHADHDTHAETSAADPHAGHEAPAQPTLALTLNGESKWVMDEHTRASVASLGEVAAQTASSVDELNALGLRFQGEIDGLIAGCTMSGAGHDQLHTFLMSFLPAVKSLSTTTDAVAGAAVLARIRALLTEYDGYFE